MCFVLALVFGFCLLLVCVYVCVCVRGGVVIEGVVLQFCVQREPLREGGGRGGGLQQLIVHFVIAATLATHKWSEHPSGECDGVGLMR